MSDLKQAVLDARYVDMISLGDFIVRDCGLPEVAADGNLMPQATEIAASLFRWAAEIPLEKMAPVSSSETSEDDSDDNLSDEEDLALGASEITEESKAEPHLKEVPSSEPAPEEEKD
jgi:hypothetical protein